MPDLPPDLYVGQEVLYVRHLCHGHDKDHEGKHVFHFTHERSDRHRERFAGQRANLGSVGELAERRPDGSVMTTAGHILRLECACHPWRAVVSETPTLRVTAVLRQGEATLEGVNPNLVHPGMQVRCLSSPALLPEDTEVTACRPPGEVASQAPEWDGGASVRSEVLEFFQGGLQLDIAHPSRRHTLHYRVDNGPCPVRYDPEGKRPHSYHFAS